MRLALTIIVGGVLFSLPLAARQSQQPTTPAPNRGVQVGVPDGPGGTPAGRGQGRGRQTGPPRPAPRSAAGRVLLGGATPDERGVWLPGPVIPNPLAMKDIPYQPWAKALVAHREINELEPHTRCKPSGVARQFLTPYGVEFVELADLQRIYIFDIGGPHTWRTVYMDGRSHPAGLVPSYYGHSVGWWEGDTLVVDTVGFNEAFWWDRDGLPHTGRLHTTERFTRTDQATIRYELTINDPGAYTAPFSGATNLRWEAGTELFEFVCQQANYANTLMVGAGTVADRTSTIVP
jgi:hypothetical protein